MCTDNGNQVSTANLEPAISTVLPVMNLHGQQKHSGKAKQLTLGSSEHDSQTVAKWYKGIVMLINQFCSS